MAKRRQIHADLILTHVEALTMRDVTGEGQQAELLVRTAAGTVAIRFVARRGSVLRLVDLRARDRKNRKAAQFVSVPFSEVINGGQS